MTLNRSFLQVLDLRIVGLLALAALSSGCQSASSPESQAPSVNEQADPTVMATAERDADGCPPEDATHEAVRIDRLGVCFLIPMDFEIADAGRGSAGILAPNTSEGGHRERMFIDMGHALGRDLDTLVDQLLADNRLPGMEEANYPVERDLRLGGSPAAVIFDLPGQSINRRVVTVIDDRRYELMFVPDEPENLTAQSQMQALFDAVTEHLVFFEPQPPMALPFIPADGGYPMSADLIWTQQDFSTGDCRMLVIEGDRTHAGTCESASISVDGTPDGWAALRDHVQPFESLGGDQSVLIRGEGDAYDPAWQIAVQHWSAASYDETISGGSDSDRTAMSWWIDETPDPTGDLAGEGMCRHLVIQSHGYAFARLDPCPDIDPAAEVSEDEEGDILAEGWLTTPEIQRFMEWFSWRAPISIGPSTLYGQGEEPVTEAETAEIIEFASHVHQTLVERASSP